MRPPVPQFRKLRKVGLAEVRVVAKVKQVTLTIPPADLVIKRMRSHFLKPKIFLILLAIFLAGERAHAIADGVLCTQDNPCKAKGLFTRRSPGPTKSDSFRMNPAEVPFESITGVEAIYYKSSFDFNLVKGLGRVGAAVSPSNSQETFFGPPAIEATTDYLMRMDERDKYKAEKYSLSTGLSLYSSEGSGFSHIDVSIGIMAKYNKATGSIKPGAGLLAIMGPLWVGASKYQDQDVIATTTPVRAYDLGVTVLSGGLAFQSIALDYSLVKVDSDAVPADATVLTASVFIRRAIFTVARREVVSTKPGFNYDTHLATYDPSKVEFFGGAQYRVAPFLVVGAHFNYYLLHEVSLGTTIFF